MAGNALPLVLLAGAALLLMKKKGDGGSTGELPADQGAGAGGGDDSGDENGAGNGNGNGEVTDEPSEEEAAYRVDWTFDPTASMPWIETVEDYQAWAAKLDATDEERVWTGALEFRDMDEHHAEIGLFIEEEMGAYGQTYGRTVDRTELDPEAKAAMHGADGMALIEKGIDETFENTPGLDFLLVFLNDSLPFKMPILFVFDSSQSQGAAMSKVADFKTKWGSMGVQVASQVGYIGMSSPSLKEVVRAFLEANLPKKSQIGGLTPTLETSTGFDPVEP